jgi:DNA-directed RNA polymerase specialized sigma24 family protein
LIAQDRRSSLDTSSTVPAPGEENRDSISGSTRHSGLEGEKHVRLAPPPTLIPGHLARPGWLTEDESMTTEGSLTRWAHELHAPDAARREAAARQIWLRFSARLRDLVRHRLDPQIRRRASADDVLQSLFASFFTAPPGPAGPPRSRADLWRLLVHFTICKVANTAERHRAQRRDVRRERPLDAADAAAERFPPTEHEPEDPRWMSPEDEAVAREEFDRLRAVVPDDLRPVLDLRLEGYTNAEIARQINRVERTVELKLRAIRGLLAPHLGGPPAES